MCFLGVFGFRGIDARFGEGLTEFFQDVFGRGFSRIGAHVDAVGAHVGDESCLVELLCDAHGVGGRESEPGACGLLEGRCGKRGRRRARDFGFFHVEHGP